MEAAHTLVSPNPELPLATRRRICETVSALKLKEGLEIQQALMIAFLTFPLLGDDFYDAGTTSKSQLQNALDIQGLAQKLADKLREQGQLMRHTCHDGDDFNFAASLEPITEGAISKFKPRALAAWARDVFEYCTGQQATFYETGNTNQRESPFTEFLTQIFLDTGTEASAAYYAELVTSEKA